MTTYRTGQRVRIMADWLPVATGKPGTVAEVRPNGWAWIEIDGVYKARQPFRAFFGPHEAEEIPPE